MIDSAAIPRDEIVETISSFPPESIGVWYLFDVLMLLADEYDAFIIDLSGPVRVTGGTTVDGDDAAELSVEAAGIEGTVTLHMAKSPKGSWRVYEVAIGGLEEPAEVWPGRGPMAGS